MVRAVDIVVDLQAGDTGKGKVTHHLLNTATEPYTAVCRFNGGGNAGHTIYHHGKKYVTHQVPSGIFFGVPCVLGLGCVVNPQALADEVRALREDGFTAPVYVDRRAHVTRATHVETDRKDSAHLGTTGQGVGPTMMDKYGRTGLRMEQWGLDASVFRQLDISVIDTFDMFHTEFTPHTVLCEGAQGFQLDVDWGDYPYVTSSHCTSGAVALNGFPPSRWRKVYGVMKPYETYSGFKVFNTRVDMEVTYAALQTLGGEIGATTGRRRQVRSLHLDDVIRAIYVNDVTDVIINKIDIMEATYTAGYTKVYQYKHNFLWWAYETRQDFVDAVTRTLRLECPYLRTITWSDSPHAV
jgi:adenylosuccinate synthase